MKTALVIILIFVLTVPAFAGAIGDDREDRNDLIDLLWWMRRAGGSGSLFPTWLSWDNVRDVVTGRHGEWWR